jgi:hypothetical protein
MLYMDMITFVSCCSIVMQYATQNEVVEMNICALTTACDSIELLSIAKRLIQHCSIQTQNILLTEALLNASTHRERSCTHC